jgi:hypothetical protein
MITIGDRVKVIDQNITGTVIRYDCGSKVVITDDDAEMWSENGEDTLVYRISELKLLDEEIK